MRWCFEPGEKLGLAFARVAGEEIARVQGGFTDADKGRAKAVHDARQGFKRLRALLRLAKPSLGSAFTVENRLWRDAARQLAGSRDHTVMLETFDGIVAECGGDLPRSDLAHLRAQLAMNGSGNDNESVEAAISAVVATLDEAAERTAGLSWPRNAKALAKGLKHSQKQLKREWKAALKTDDPHALHDWRKRVKDQSSHLRLFRHIAPPAILTRHASEKKTAELLGLEHDYWMLVERLEKESLPSDVAATRDILLDELGARRVSLREQAMALGETFSAEEPKAFARTLIAAWQTPPADADAGDAASETATSRAS